MADLMTKCEIIVHDSRPICTPAKLPIKVVKCFFSNFRAKVLYRCAQKYHKKVFSNPETGNAQLKQMKEQKLEDLMFIRHVEDWLVGHVCVSQAWDTIQFALKGLVKISWILFLYVYAGYWIKTHEVYKPSYWAMDSKTKN